MGTFESHITVELNNKRTLSLFQTLCQKLKVKCLLIELPSGINNLQPMTSLYHKGNFEPVLKEVQSLAQTIAQEGFKVTRVKIEALVNNLNVPSTDEEAQKFPKNYFEFHVLATLKTEEEKDKLKALCKNHNAHLSQNAFKQSLLGLNQHFITMRVYNIGKIGAKLEFSKLVNELKKENFNLSNKLQEYIVYDSNTSIDQGWIEPVSL